MLSVAVLIAVFWLAQPWLRPLGNLNLVIFFVGVAGFCVFAGVPIAFGFGLAIFGYLALTTHTPLMVLVGRMDEGMSHLILLAVPLFVFLGLLIEMTGMARAMVAFLASLLGHVRGGLHYVLVGAMYLVSGISGSKAADMAAVAPVLFPEMKTTRRQARRSRRPARGHRRPDRNHSAEPRADHHRLGDRRFDLGAVHRRPAARRGAGDHAVGAGVVALSRRRPQPRQEGRRPARSLRSFVIALPALALPFVIRAAVVEGIATATEVSTIGIVYGFVVGLLVYRQFDWRRLMPMLIETACLSGAILLIIGTATGMAWGLTQSGFSRALAAAMTGLPGGARDLHRGLDRGLHDARQRARGHSGDRAVRAAAVSDRAAVGVHEVHYAMIIILAMGIGLFAPPFGVGYYAACAIGRVDPAEGIRPIWGYMLALLVGLIVVAIFPWISIGFL